MRNRVRKTIPYEILKEEYSVKRKSIATISKEQEIGNGTVFRLLKKYKIPANEYESSWNSGKTHLDDSRILAGDRHPRRKRKEYYTSTFKRLRKVLLPANCASCGKEATLLHHKDKNKMNDNLKNLVPLCASCHTTLHNRDRGITIFNRICENPLCKKPFQVKHNRNRNRKYCCIECHYENTRIINRERRSKDSKKGTGRK